MTSPVNDCEFKIIEAPWPQYREYIAELRREVFIVEQQVPEALEWDDLDHAATHLCLFDANNSNSLIGYTRLISNGKLTRMAVKQSQRKKGIGSALVRHACQLAKARGLNQIKLDAQLSAQNFYHQLGFAAHGKEFWDAGIKHIHMTKHL